MGTVYEKGRGGDAWTLPKGALEKLLQGDDILLHLEAEAVLTGRE